MNRPYSFTRCWTAIIEYSASLRTRLFDRIDTRSRHEGDRLASGGSIDNRLGRPADDHPVGSRREFEFDNRHLQSPDEREDRRLTIETAARETKVRGVGWELVERGINGQPEPAPIGFRECTPRARRGSKTRRA